MASWAGAYGAGGASDALRQLVADRLVQAKFAEEQRQAQAREAADAADRAQRGQQFTAQQALQMEELSGRRDDRYQDRTTHVEDQNRALQRQTLEDQIRAKERTEDVTNRTTERADTQAFQDKELKARQSFESLMAGRERGSGAAEPLVAISDPATGQPKLVPRSQAVGAKPASTREQGALTEGQSNAAGFADRMKFNEDYIKGFETDATSRSTQAAGWLPNEMRSDAYQQYDSAKQNWIAANLRKESGAAISESEYKGADRQYFPQPGESAAVITQKRALRAVAEAAMRRASGTAAGPPAAPAAPQGNDLGKEW